MWGPSRRRVTETLAVVLVATIAALAIVPSEHTPPAGYPALSEAALPLDDAYIFLRFAQQIARGQGLEWSDGVGSSGATSIAFLPLLLPGQLSDELSLQVVWSRCVGWATLALLGLAALHLFRSLRLPQPADVLASMAVVLSGPAAWGAMAGMESALNAAAILFACSLWVRVFDAEADLDTRQLVWAVVATGLLPLARPENLVLSGIGFLAAASVGAFRGRRLLALLALVPGGLLGLLNLALTGNPKPAGALAKSITEFAFLDPRTVWALYDLNLGEKLLPAYLGQRGALLWAPVGWVALAVALSLPVLVLRRRERCRGLGLVGLAWWVLFLTAPLSAMVEWQKMRHHHAGLVLAWVLALAAVTFAIERLRAHFDAPTSSRWALALAPALLLLALPGWRADYRLQTEHLLLRHGPAAEWLATNATGMELLLNDAGYLAVRHDGPMIDAIGLGTPVLASPYRHGPGATVEALARLEPAPPLAAVNLDVFHLEPLLGHPLGPAPHRETDTLVAEVRAELLQATELRARGVDFADLESEAAFDLDWAPEPHPLEPSRLALLDEGSGETAQGCRPLRDRLLLTPPPGASTGSLLVIAPEGSSVEVEVRAEVGGRPVQTIVPAGGWRRLDFQVAERLQLRRISEATPCLESLSFDGG